MAATSKALCIDARDHQALADWWCTAMGYVRRDDVDPDPDDDWTRPREWPVPIVDPAGNGPAVWVVPVPEDKGVENRLHRDVHGSTDELVALGATVVRAGDRPSEDPPDHETGAIDRDVLADPEGNEFRVFAPTPEA